MRAGTLRYGRHAICGSQAVTDLCVCCLSEINFVSDLFTYRSFLDYLSYYFPSQCAYLLLFL